MSTVPVPAKVLVTGANGFIAVHIVRILLEQGYSVRGTVRAASKGEFVKKLFEKYGDKFEFTVVPDMTKEGAFDASVTDVDAVLHTAAPVEGWSRGASADDFVKPAVEGMTTVLNSIVRAGTKVRRVVITSSAVALWQPQAPGYHYTESDWNEYAVQEVKEKGADAAPYLFYIAAKTLSEQAAWDFVAKHKTEINWELTTLLPPYVFGPILQQTAGDSSGFLYTNIQQEKSAAELGAHVGPWVDVRDIALAHVLSLQKEKAGGERLIISGGEFAWQDVLDALKTIPDVRRGVPGVKRDLGTVVDPTKADGVLGLKYHTLEESAKDTVLSLRERLGAN